MLQSSQCWMPRLHEPVKFTDVVAKATQEKKYIGHLLEEDKQLAEDKITFAKGNKRMLSEVFDASIHSHIILIGPEGDFSPTEIKLAVDKQFIPVSMGKTTLRVETAGLYAAAVCR
ncbi:MAG: RsmE family RNA methyltransferase, partial [Chitinophagaceae bacterium]|nr:RsmE family RNA methyltransferase [Chitinophagaceae bacterium]